MTSKDRGTNEGFWLGTPDNSPPPANHVRLSDGLDRRDFLGLMAASTALAGLQGCRRPDIEILPYARMPEAITPGIPLFYATCLAGPGGARPVLVETHGGRPTKIEGHPKHPYSQGATDLWTQANILELYDPDRSRFVRHDGTASSWEDFDRFASEHFGQALSHGGSGLCFLEEGPSMPATRLLRRHLASAAPLAAWHRYDTYGEEYVERANEAVLGRRLHTRYAFDRARTILALDADFLGVGEGHSLRYARAFVDGRQPDDHTRPMSRLYVVEPTFTVTGGMADHRWRLPRYHMVHFLLWLAEELGLDLTPLQDMLPADIQSRLATIPPDSIKEMAADLRGHRGESIVMPGRAQPPSVHALALVINHHLDNLNRTVTFTALRDDPVPDLQALVNRLHAGEVDTLVMMGGNPAYDTPVDHQFAEQLRQIPTTIRFGLYEDETSRCCSWHVPAAHPLETWGDAETLEGGYSPVQPLIAPLFRGRSLLEFVARLIRWETTEPYEIAQRSFAEQIASRNQDLQFDRFLHDGYLAGWPSSVETVELDRERAITSVREFFGVRKSVRLGTGDLELTFHLDAGVCDGRFANNGWLQELPDPVTKLTWDNAALISRQTAQELGVLTGDVVRLTVEDRSLEIPLLVTPGQADGSLAVALGYGRSHAGRVGNGVGFNAYLLRSSDAPFVATGVTVEKTGRRHEFACTQSHWSLDGRDIVRESPLAAFHEPRDSASPAAGDQSGEHHDEQPATHATHGGGHDQLSLIESPRLSSQHQWGMAIDLNRCIGCSACMVACQSENNIPIVGKGEVANGRSMHWIRVDRYFRGRVDEPTMIHQPVACVHCENAPCETVCPVNAAVHSPEGLNLQVYNRCVGTRYCSNNCPYKVRRFNWFDYHQRPLDGLRWGPLTEKGSPETLKMQKNPDVTVRMRGVMEKCTYCVQRIERAKTGARLANPTAPQVTIPDGTIVPACAQACPARAIVFGDLSDSNSHVNLQQRDPRHFGLLAELGTKPRTSYLARVRNPHPRISQSLPWEEDQST